MDTNEDGRLGQQAFVNAMAAPIPRFYMNGFVFGQSFSDIALVMQLNGMPSAVVNMSFTTAKSLAQDLNALITNFEQATSHQIMSMGDVQSKTASDQGPVS